ncbi:hypothetical protein DTO280E4_2001 [Paecilomyces variotii]|nr:hypothetical protein DTO280E4_2001 [Paecilomyces variotii]
MALDLSQRLLGVIESNNISDWNQKDDYSVYSTETPNILEILDEFEREPQDEDSDNEDPLNTIDNQPTTSTKPLFGIFSQAKYLQYSQTIPEYPSTHPEGVAYCVNVSNLTQSTIDNYHSQVQYVLNRHDQENITNNRTDQQRLEETSNRLYDSGIYQRDHRCPDSCRNGGLKLGYDHTKDLYWLRCNQWFPSDSAQHYFQYLPRTLNFDHTHLRELCNSQASNSNPTSTTGYTGISTNTTSTTNPRICSLVESVRARSKYCAYHGVSSPIQTVPCDVQFLYITPKDYQQVPFVLFVSFGTHRHPPPPTAKVPRDIWNDITKIIQKTDTRGLTVGRFIRNSNLQQYLKENNATRLSQIHPALNNQDIIRQMIYKEKLLRNPFGESYDAVLFQFLMKTQNSQSHEYIRDMYNDGVNIRIICFSQEQSVAFSKQRSFQVDMTYKRTGNGFNEVVFATMPETVGNAVVLARVFVNKDSTTMYTKLFEKIFPLLAATSNSSSHRFNWWHIDGSGIQAVITDMCHKQAAGLGRYLYSIDNTRSWQEHIMHTTIFCLIHYFRGVHRKYRSFDAYQLMRRLVSETTKSNCDRILQTLRNHNNRDIRTWVKHKEIPWILSGLNANYSRMPSITFNTYQRNSNAVEAIHHRDQVLTGTGISLLSAIIQAQDIDNRAVHGINQYLETGVRPASNLSTPLRRIQNRPVQATPSISTVTSGIASPIDLTDSPDPPVATQAIQSILDRFNSSGVTGKRKRTRQAMTTDPITSPTPNQKRSRKSANKNLILTATGTTGPTDIPSFERLPSLETSTATGNTNTTNDNDLAFNRELTALQDNINRQILELRKKYNKM